MNKLPILGFILAALPGLAVDGQEPCRDSKCKIDMVNVNTGFDQGSGAPYSPVQPDGYWELVDAPNPPNLPTLTMPSPAWAITADPAWDSLPNSNWISAYNTSSLNANNDAPLKPYSFQRCFCTCDGVESVVIDLQMLIDNYGDVYFDNVLIGSQPNPVWSSFHNPALVIHAVRPVTPGKHCLRIDLRNKSGVAMGVDMVGTVKNAGAASGGFVSAACCDPTGKIFGKKIQDTNCNGKDDSEPGLAGWVITATNTITHAVVTATTDAAGFYYFNNLPAGTYTIAETAQSGWSQTIPGGAGTYTVVLGANQIVEKDFGNCQGTHDGGGDVSGCAGIATPEIRCDPAGGYTVTFNVANNSGSAMSQILLTPTAGSTFTVSPQLSHLSPPLQNGQSTTVTTNIGNGKAGDKVCFFVSLMSDGAPCCTVQVCWTLPTCGDHPGPVPQRHPGKKGR